MNYFNKLKGFQRSPAGWEWQIWKRLHIILAVGTVLPLLASAGVYVLDEFEITRALEQFFYVMVGLVVLMKGPAYVADAYAMEEPTRDKEASIQR
jgi:hypothetical protein